MKIFYTGVGSRKTPAGILRDMEHLGSLLSERGLILRSGASEGADTAFEKGCDKVRGEKEIYLPWRGFGKSNSDKYFISEVAYSSVDLNHLLPSSLTEIARKLLARNYHQVVGYDDIKSLFIICWTPKGVIDGGTGQTIRVANSLNIPVFNLALMGVEEVVEKIDEILNERGEC